VVDALLDRGFAVHAINPKQLERLRDRSSVAGAKDDRRDARVAAAGLRTDPQLFRRVAVGDPAVVELREWSRLAEELQQERVRLANREFRQAGRKLDELCAAMTRSGMTQSEGTAGGGSRDAAILASLPGVGRSTLAALLAEAAGPLARRDRAALRTLSGVAPVTKRSGKSHVVVMRHAAQARLRQAVFHWARMAVQKDPRSRSRYEALRARGHSCGRALRGVADRLLGVACVLLRRRVPFDPDHGKPTAA
jgi:transposase